MPGVYAVDGSINITVVSGSSYTGLYATDGSINVVAAPGGSFVGTYHPCGAWYVTLVTSGSTGYYAVDGSTNVSVSPYVQGSLKVTVVAGSFAPGTGFLPWGLLGVYMG